MSAGWMKNIRCKLQKSLSNKEKTMLRNLLVGILAATLVVALGTAAYNVISAQAQGGIAAPLAGNGRGNGNGNGNGTPQATPVWAGAGQTPVAVQSQTQTQFGNGHQGAPGQSNGSGVPQVQAQASLANVSTVRGTVSAYAYGTLTIVTEDGQTMGIQLGNQRYVASLGLNPQAGQVVTVTGFPGDQGLFTATQIVMADGTTYTFRQETGRPAWAGGNGKGNH